MATSCNGETPVRRVGRFGPNSRLQASLSKHTFLVKSLYKLGCFGPWACRRSSGEPFAEAYKEKSLQAKLMRKSHFKRKGVREIP